MKHIISFSGGVGSWAAAKRVAARYGTKDLILLFADVLMEDSEIHRLERLQKRCAPFRYEAPLCEKPYLDKAQMLDLLRAEGIEPPRLYGMGFPHNNCGGFCVKAGQAQFRLLLEKMPERYAYHEKREQEIREFLHKDVSVLRDRRGGESKPLTLKDFRERLERDKKDCDTFEWGGCGCALDDDATVAGVI